MSHFVVEMSRIAGQEAVSHADYVRTMITAENSGIPGVRMMMAAEDSGFPGGKLMFLQALKGTGKAVPGVDLDVVEAALKSPVAADKVFRDIIEQGNSLGKIRSQVDVALPAYLHFGLNIAVQSGLFKEFAQWLLGSKELREQIDQILGSELPRTVEGIQQARHRMMEAEIKAYMADDSTRRMMENQMKVSGGMPVELLHFEEELHPVFVEAFGEDYNVQPEIDEYDDEYEPEIEEYDEECSDECDEECDEECLDEPYRLSDAPGVRPTPGSRYASGDSTSKYRSMFDVVRGKGSKAADAALDAAVEALASERGIPLDVAEELILNRIQLRKKD